MFYELAHFLFIDTDTHTHTEREKMHNKWMIFF